MSEIKKETEQVANPISIQPLKVARIVLTVESLEGSSMLMQRLNPETADRIVNKERGVVNEKRFRDFDKEYDACFHRCPDGSVGIPASAFFNAILDTAVSLDIPKTRIKRAMRVVGDLLPLIYEKKDLVRNISYPKRSGMTGAPDVRHRPEFLKWSCKLPVLYDPMQISLDEITNLVERSGFSSGVGSWRPSSPKSSGQHGMYRIKTNINNQKK